MKAKLHKLKKLLSNLLSKKTIIIFYITCFLFLSCNNSKSKSTTVEDVIQKAKETTAVVAKEGRGNISLQCSGKTYEINGVCGALTSMGSVSIVVKDDSTKLKVFTIDFSTDQLPTSSSSYKIIKNADDKDAHYVSIGYNDMRQPQMIWESDNATGKLDFTVNGDEIKCSFSNLKLQANEFFNKGELNNPAIVSGELTLYKN